MKIFAFSGSNSSTSINKQLVAYAASLFGAADVQICSMGDFEMPLFGVDLEKQIGQHPTAQQFLDKIAAADVILASLPENNGSYSAAFKNVFDLASRIDVKVFQNKPMLLMATSPGQRGGKSALELAQSNLPRYGADIRAVFSLPQFNQNFDTDRQAISNAEFDTALRRIVQDFSIA